MTFEDLDYYDQIAILNAQNMVINNTRIIIKKMDRSIDILRSIFTNQEIVTLRLLLTHNVDLIRKDREVLEMLIANKEIDDIMKRTKETLHG